ncbi:MAG: DUF1592 domain-containing protein [Myxococcaceae bacterium]
MRTLLVAAAVVLFSCTGQTPPVRLGGPAPAPSAASGAKVEAPIRRLTRAQYHRAVLDLFAPLGWTESPAWRFPADEHAGPFSTNVRAAPTALDVDLAFAAAESMARRASPAVEQLLGCNPLTVACAQGGVARFARRAWKRSLTPTEQQALAALWEGREVREGTTLALTAVLASPFFLELAEPGEAAADGRVALTGPQVAARLGLLFRGGLPDEALLDAAERGELSTPDGVAAASWRLLRDDRAVAALTDFHFQWLGLTAAAEKDPARFPMWGTAARDAALSETSQFVDTVIRRSDGRFETLLSAPFTFLPPPLERVYGLKPALPGVMVGLPSEQRRGVLTLTAFLSTHAQAKLTSPTQRGLTLTRDVLCLSLGSPPPNVDLTPVGVDPTGAQSRRSLIEQHGSDPRCSGCHRVMDPMGLAFEHYDAVGAWREVDLDDRNPIDSAVTVSLGDPQLDGPVTSATELVQRLSRSSMARRCYVTQWYRYALGRLETSDDASELAALQERFERSGGSIPDLLVALTTTDAFRSRR